jgi:GMP synthase-like glutamine amidotransferase
MRKVIGILNAYHFDTTPGSYQELYEPMILKYFKRIMPGVDLVTYQVAQNQFPKDINECDGWVITGSPASSYDKETWITNLANFTKKCHESKKKVLGICFGHQLIAQALGGEVENSNKGWGIGVRSFDVINKLPWMGKEESCSVLFSHQDQVTKLPSGSIHLGTDPFCNYQMFSIGEHIFSLQGHPEFTKEYAEARYSTRKSAIGLGVYQEGIESLKNDVSDDILESWINNFLA